MIKKGDNVEERAIASGAEILLVDGAPPKRIQLFPMGRHIGKDGRGPWELTDRAHAEAVVAATQAKLGNTEMMVDYDHQAVHAQKVAGTAPASGWVHGFHVEDDGIWADVDWTAAAAAKIVAKEYRYISPFFGFDKATGRLTRFFNAALVNIPALEVAAVAAQSFEGEIMDLKAIAAALGLSATATEAEVLAAAAKANGDAAAAAAASTQIGAIATALGLSDDIKPEGDLKPEDVAMAAAAIKTAIAAAKTTALPDPTKFVPVSQLELVNSKLARIDEERATASVDAAIKSGKLAPAARQWGIDLAKKDEAAFASFVSVAPALLTEGGDPVIPTPKNGELTTEEKAVCAQMGLTEEEFKNSKEGLSK